MKLCAHPLTDKERITLEVRLGDLLRFLNSPGDWGYDTRMGDLALYLIQFRSLLHNEPKQETTS